MNQLACYLCQQQFKTASGLSWHLDRIHDRLAVDAHSDPSSFDEAYVEADSPEITVESLRAELAEQSDEFVEYITRLSHDMEEVKGRLREAEKTALTVQALSAETSRQSDRDAEIDELLQAVSTLLWDLDRPNRRSPIFPALASGGPVRPSDLSGARERIEVFLRHVTLRLNR